MICDISKGKARGVFELISYFVRYDVSLLINKLIIDLSTKTGATIIIRNVTFYSTEGPRNR